MVGDRSLGITTMSPASANQAIRRATRALMLRSSWVSAVRSAIIFSLWLLETIIRRIALILPVSSLAPVVRRGGAERCTTEDARALTDLAHESLPVHDPAQMTPTGYGPRRVAGGNDIDKRSVPDLDQLRHDFHLIIRRCWSEVLDVELDAERNQVRRQQMVGHPHARRLDPADQRGAGKDRHAAAPARREFACAHPMDMRRLETLPEGHAICSWRWGTGTAAPSF